MGSVNKVLLPRGILTFYVLFNQLSVLADELDEAVDGLFLRDVLFDTLLSLVEGDLASTCTYIAVVGIGHLTRAIHDTAHDADLKSHQVLSSRLNLGDGLLKIVKRTTTSRTGDILGLGKLDAGSLEDAISQFI